MDRRKTLNSSAAILATRCRLSSKIKKNTCSVSYRFLFRRLKLMAPASKCSMNQNLQSSLLHTPCCLVLCKLPHCRKKPIYNIAVRL